MNADEEASGTAQPSLLGFSDNCVSPDLSSSSKQEIAGAKPMFCKALGCFGANPRNVRVRNPTIRHMSWVHYADAVILIVVLV